MPQWGTRKPASRAVPMNVFEKTFKDRTETIYEGMKKRAKKYGRFVPFTLQEFRAIVMDNLGGRPDGVIQCTYCTMWLNIKTLCLDHRTPVAPPWNGGFEAENLAASCHSCNSRKGKISEPGFRKLVEWVTENLDRRDQGDLFNRLSHGGKGQQQAWKEERAKKAAKPNPQTGLFS